MFIRVKKVVGEELRKSRIKNAKKIRRVRVVKQEEQEHQVEEIHYVSHLLLTKMVHS